MNCLKCYGLKVSQISQSHLYKHVQKHLYNITWTVAIKIWPNTSSHNKQISWFTFLFLRFLILNKQRAKCVVLMYRIYIFEKQIAEEIQQKYLKITHNKTKFWRLYLQVSQYVRRYQVTSWYVQLLQRTRNTARHHEDTFVSDFFRCREHKLDQGCILDQFAKASVCYLQIQ